MIIRNIFDFTPTRSVWLVSFFQKSQRTFIQTFDTNISVKSKLHIFKSTFKPSDFGKKIALKGLQSKVFGPNPSFREIIFLDL